VKAKVLSLSRARKTRDKVRKRAKADENAVKFGQSKSEKKLSVAKAEKATQRLDAHKRDEP